MVTSISPSSSSSVGSPPSPLLTKNDTLKDKSFPASPRTSSNMWMNLFVHNVLINYGTWILGYCIYYYLTRYHHIFEAYMSAVFGVSDYNETYIARKYGSLLVIHAFFWIACFICYFFYWLQHPAIEKYKINPTQPWPWQHEDAEKRKQFWDDQKKDLPHIIMTQIFFCFMGEDFPLETRPDMLPNPIIELAWLKLMSLFYECLFFMFHWMMHTRYMYWFHKTHHSPTAPICHHARYNHVLDFFITNGLPTILMGHWPGLHRQTFTYFFIGLHLRGVDDHCGYNFEPSIFSFVGVAPSAEYHYYHHTSFMHNYGSPYYDHPLRNDHHFSYIQYQQHQTPEYEPKQHVLRAHAQQVRVVIELIVSLAIVYWL